MDWFLKWWYHLNPRWLDQHWKDQNKGFFFKPTNYELLYLGAMAVTQLAPPLTLNTGSCGMLITQHQEAENNRYLRPGLP